MATSWDLGELPKTNMKEMVIIAGTIVTENTTPTIAAGKGFTVAKNGTGHYRITFNRKVPRIIAAVGQYSNTTTPRLLKKVAHTEGNNYVEFVFEDTSGSAAEPGVTDQLEFIVIGMLVKLPKV